MTWQDIRSTQASLAANAMMKNAENCIIRELSALIGAPLSADAAIQLSRLGRLTRRWIAGVEIFSLDGKPFLSIGQPEIRLDGFKVTVTQQVSRIEP